MLKTLYRSLATCALALSGIFVSQALPASYYTMQPTLSTGRWVKIKVSETGMQQLTFEQLRAMGFSDPAKVAVYGYPGIAFRNFVFAESMPDDLPAVPTAIYGDKLVFHGVGRGMASLRKYTTNKTNFVTLHRNVYGLDSYYYLTDSQPVKRVEVSDVEFTESTPVDNAYGFALRDFTDIHCGLSPLLFSENFAASPLPVELYMPGYDPSLTDDGSASNVRVSFAVAGMMPASSNATAQFEGDSQKYTVAFTGYNHDSKYWKFRYPAVRNVSFSALARPADDKYRVSLTLPSGADAQSAMCDYVGARYRRTTSVGEVPQQHMVFSRTRPGMGVALSDAPRGIRVWAVSPDAAPVEYAVKALGDTGSNGVVTASNLSWSETADGLDLLVFDPAANLNVPEVVGEVRNSNLHATATPEYLIVTNDANFDEGLRLADFHRTLNPLVSDVTVVRFSDLIDEFGSGQYHPMTLRRFIKMLYDRDPSKLKGVFILAPAETDNTGVSVAGGVEHLRTDCVPMLESEDTAYGSFGREPDTYASDAIYGMLADDFYYNRGSWVEKEGTRQLLRAKLDINVGRVSAESAADAAIYVDKVRKYLAEPTSRPLWNRALVLAGAGDRNDFFNQGVAVNSQICGSSLKNGLSPSTVVSNIYLSHYPAGKASTLRVTQNRIAQQLSRGTGLFVYFGHSLLNIIIGEGNTWSSNLDRSLGVDDTPFTMFATCETMVFDKRVASLQCDMLMNPIGGMVGGVGPSRPVYAAFNKMMAYAVVDKYYSSRPGAFQGDVYRNARNHLCVIPSDFGGSVQSQMHYVNHMSYNFGGDPMLPLRVPGGSAVIETIDGNAPGSSVNLAPFTEYTFAGSVRDASGAVDTDFNGNLTLSFYDGRYSRGFDPSRVDAANPDTIVMLEDMLLQETMMSVRGGRFSGKVMLSCPAYTGEGNRVTLYAVTDDRSHSAVGNLAGVSLSNDAPDGDLGVAAPRITRMYAEDLSFVNGDAVPASFTLYADIDATGSMLLGNSDRLGGSVSITLDDSRKLSGADGALKISPDGTASMAFPVTGLSDGIHRLRLSVKSITGESDEREITVSVVNVAEATLRCADAHVREKAELSVDTNLTESLTGRLVIATPDGHVVYTDPEASFASPYVWALDDASGNPVPDGLYHATFHFRSGRHFGSTPPLDIFVGR